MSTTAYAGTALLGAIVGGVLTYWYLTPSTGTDDFIKANDDDPIIMAGGSLHVFTHHAKFNKKGTVLAHKDTTRHVTEVDVLYGNPLKIDSPAFSKPLQISMPYCGDPPGCTTTDTVQFLTDNNGQGLTLSNKDGTIIGEVKGNEVNHLPEKGHISLITVAGTAQQYVCPDGKCFLIIHYGK